MKPEEIALILEQAKGYTNSQRLAYSETKKFTWDGDITGRVTFPAIFGEPLDSDYDMCYVHISSEVPSVTAETIKKIESVVDYKGTINKTEKDGSQFAFDGGIGISLVFDTEDFPDLATHPVLCVLSEDIIDDGYGNFIPKGISVRYGKFGEVIVYPSLLELETIHPIPQEYIPPLDQLILNGLDGKQYRLTVDEAGELSCAEVV